jgi:hypothetical protein
MVETMHQGSAVFDCARFIPPIAVPEGRLYGYPTRLAACWSPLPERIIMPAYEVPGAPFNIGVSLGRTNWIQTMRGPIRGIPRLKKLARIQFAQRQSDWHLSKLFWDYRELVEGNIAHVLLYLVPQVMLARQIIREYTGQDRPITVILRWRAAPIARKVLDRLGIDYICTDAEIRGPQVTIDFPRMVYHPSAFDFEFPGYTSDTPERIFISRRGVRTILNEDEVMEVLAPQGFVRCYFEDLELSRQWSIMRNAREIIAIHGAALGAMVFNRAGEHLRLLELFSAGYVADCYRELAALYGGRWAALRGPITSQIVRDVEERAEPRSHANTSFKVDVRLLEEALGHLGTGRPVVPQPALIPARFDAPTTAAVPLAADPSSRTQN